jgi:hypothetical protein
MSYGPDICEACYGFGQLPECPECGRRPPWKAPSGRPLFRLWDTEVGDWYHPIYDGAGSGKIEEVLLMPTSGHLMMRRQGGMSHESVFPDRFVLVHVGWT